MALAPVAVSQNYQDLEGNPLANGYLVVKLLSDAQSPTGQVCKGLEVIVPLDGSGNISSLSMWDNSLLNTGSGTDLYEFKAYTSAGQLVGRNVTTVNKALTSITVTPANSSIHLMGQDGPIALTDSISTVGTGTGTAVTTAAKPLLAGQLALLFAHSMQGTTPIPSSGTAVSPWTAFANFFYRLLPSNASLAGAMTESASNPWAAVLLSFTFANSNSSGAPHFVQGNVDQYLGTTPFSSTTVALSTPVVTGNTLIVCMKVEYRGFGSNDLSLTSITDNKGNVYTLFSVYNTNSVIVLVGVCINAIGGAGVVATVQGGGSVTSFVSIYEIAAGRGTGTSLQLTATGSYNNGTTADITSSSTWTSSVPADVAVSSTGFASAVALGTSNITATQSPISGFTPLTVIT